MAIQIIIQDQRPDLVLQNDSKIFVIDYKVLKGAKGDAGDPANVIEHLDQYDHGMLHEHAAGILTLLDNLEYSAEDGLTCFGVGAKDFIEPNNVTLGATSVVYSGTDQSVGWDMTGVSLEIYQGNIRLVETRTYRVAP